MFDDDNELEIETGTDSVKTGTDTDTDTGTAGSDDDDDNFTCCPGCGSDNIEDTNPDDLDSDEVECNNCGWIGMTSDLARG